MSSQPVISANEYEVSNLYDSASLELPGQDKMLQPVMHILQESSSSEAEDFELSDSEKYKLVDDVDMSEDFTVDLQDSTDSDYDGKHDVDDDSEDTSVNKKKSPPAAQSFAQKQYTFHEYTQIPLSKNLVVKRTDETPGPVVCKWQECDKKFDSPEDLSRHLDFEHDLSKWVCFWIPCSRQLKPFDARYKLIVHLRCHTGEKPYKCTIAGCLRKFSRIENMKLHIRTHTGEKPYACSYEGCTKKFNNSSDRAKHMKTHIQTKPYKCKHPGCSKYYTDPSSMRKHYRSIHFQGEQSNLRRRRDYSGTPVKQPCIAPRPPINAVTPVNTRSIDTSLNQAFTSQSQDSSSVTIATNSNANCNNRFVQVPVFQLPQGSGGESTASNPDMSQLIQQGKMQPILLQNSNQQSMLMFVPTANVQLQDVRSGLTMIPVLQQQQPLPLQQSQQQSHKELQQEDNTDISHVVEDEPVNRPAKNIHVIVSSARSKEKPINQITSNTTVTK